MTENSINFEKAIELTRSLVKINSENPHTSELAVQKFLELKLIKMGFEFDLIPSKPDRNNIVARFPPIKDAKNFDSKYIMFSGHMDTVPGYIETNAAESPIKDGRIWGRGTSDMKGAIACFLTAIEAFIENNDLRNPVNLDKIKKGICISLTVEEEMGCLGVKAMSKYHRLNRDFWVDFCILCEPTGLYTGIGHKGIVWFKIEFKGKAAHASTPASGVNAIDLAAKFIVGLEKLKDELGKRHLPDNVMFSPPTLNVGTIIGGNKTNVVPDKCIIKIDRRLVPGESPESATSEIEKIIHNLNLQNHAKISVIQSGGAYILPRGSENELCKEILEITNVYKKNVEYKPFCLSGFTEADPYFTNFGFPVIILGPDGSGIHGLKESIRITQIQDATRIYYDILTKYVKL
jgi:acetylornithine deacetylase/succinyl-diaminopimelate desuccinylase family protein